MWSPVKGSSFQTTCSFTYFKIGGQNVGNSSVVLDGNDSHKQTSGDVTPLVERTRNTEAKVALGAVWCPQNGAWTVCPSCSK